MATIIKEKACKEIIFSPLPPEGAYTIKQVSQMIGVSVSTVHMWIYRGQLKASLCNAWLHKRHSKSISGPTFYSINSKNLKEFIINPPNSRAKGIMALIEKETFRKLTGNESKKYRRRSYRASAKSTGWALS
jgi:transposase